MKKILILTLLLTLLSSISAAEIIEENITVDLETYEVDVDIKAETTRSDSFSYITSYPIEEFQYATVNGEETECSVEDLPPGSSISCNVEDRENFNINLNYKASGLVGERNTVNIFGYNHNIYRSTDYFKLTVLLPQGASLAGEDQVNESIIQPADGEITSDGSRIIVSWETEPEGLPNLSFKTFYTNNNQEFNIFLYLIIGLVAGLIIIGSSIIGWKAYKRKDRSSVLEKLSEDELEIVEMINENEGEMLQKDVVEESGYSKAKISGVVSDLVEKEVLEKEKEGRSNKLVLKDKYNS